MTIAALMRRNSTIIVSLHLTIPSQRSESGDTSRNADPQTIANLILRGLRQDTRQNQPYRPYQQMAPLRMHNCGTCGGGDHPTDKCRITNPIEVV